MGERAEVDREARKPEREIEIVIRERKEEEEGWRVRKDGSLMWASGVITALPKQIGSR